MTDIAEVKRQGRRLQAHRQRRLESGNGSRSHPDYADPQYGTFGESGLTDRQYAYALYRFMYPHSAKEAAIKAGYSVKSAASQGHYLDKHAGVQSVINELRDRLMENTEVTMERVVNEVAAIAFSTPSDSPKTADKLRANEMLAKWLGFDRPSDAAGEFNIVVSFTSDDERLIDDAEWEDADDA